MIADVDKIGKLWNVFEGKEKVGGGKFYWKIVFLGRSFWMEAARVEEKMMLKVRF